MNPAGIVLRVTALAATSVCLLATSRPPCEPEGRREDQTRSYRVSGTCGPAGEVTLVAPKKSCGVTVEGATAVGLPESGTSGNPEDFADLHLGSGRERLPPREFDDGGSRSAAFEGPVDWCDAVSERDHIELRCFDARGGECEAVLDPQ